MKPILKTLIISSIPLVASAFGAVPDVPATQPTTQPATRPRENVARSDAPLIIPDGNHENPDPFPMPQNGIINIAGHRL